MIINPHYTYLKQAPAEASYVSFSSDGFFSIQLNGNWEGTLYYSRDKVTWGTVTSHGTTIAAVEADNKYELFFRGLNNTVITAGNSWVCTSSEDINVSGNILTLLNYLDPASAQMGNSCFEGMFRNWTTLISTPTLPSMSLSSYCYRQMFSGCTSLMTAPALPATTLATGCYQEMFSGCISLRTTPTLNAMTLVSTCYQGMFSNCTTLPVAPALPATTLASNCYENMFAGCSSLTTATTLPATIVVDSCYSNMFLNCISLTTIPLLRADTLAMMCYGSMFAGCSLVKISETQVGEYVNAYPIGTDTAYGTFLMFMNTGGTFTGTPNGGTTYYTSNTVV